MSVVLHAFEDLAVEEELEWFTMTLDTLVIPVGRVSLTQRNATIFIEDKDSEYIHCKNGRVKTTQVRLLQLQPPILLS